MSSPPEDAIMVMTEDIADLIYGMTRISDSDKTNGPAESRTREKSGSTDNIVGSRKNSVIIVTDGAGAKSYAD